MCGGGFRETSIVDQVKEGFFHRKNLDFKRDMEPLVSLGHLMDHKQCRCVFVFSSLSYF